MATDDQLAMIHLVEKFRSEHPLPGLTALLGSPHMKVRIDWPAYLGLSEAGILAELQRWRLRQIEGVAAEMARCPGEISQEAAQVTRGFGEADCGREWAAEFARRAWDAWRLGYGRRPSTVPASRCTQASPAVLETELHDGRQDQAPDHPGLQRSSARTA